MPHSYMSRPASASPSPSPQRTTTLPASASTSAPLTAAILRVGNTPPDSLYFYLCNEPKQRKTLVIGCGKTPQNVTMGAGHTRINGEKCSLGSDHRNDFTVDISADAGADAVINFLPDSSIEPDMANHTKLSKFAIQGLGKFDEVKFEYLSKGLPGPDRKNVFSEVEIHSGISAAHNLLKAGGKISFYNGSKNYLDMAKAKLKALGYKISTIEEGTHKYCQGIKRSR